MTFPFWLLCQIFPEPLSQLPTGLTVNRSKPPGPGITKHNCNKQSESAKACERWWFAKTCPKSNIPTTAPAPLGVSAATLAETSMWSCDAGNGFCFFEMGDGEQSWGATREGGQALQWVLPYGPMPFLPFSRNNPPCHTTSMLAVWECWWRPGLYSSTKRSSESGEPLTSLRAWRTPELICLSRPAQCLGAASPLLLQHLSQMSKLEHGFSNSEFPFSVLHHQLSLFHFCSFFFSFFLFFFCFFHCLFIWGFKRTPYSYLSSFLP